MVTFTQTQHNIIREVLFGCCLFALIYVAYIGGMQTNNEMRSYVDKTCGANWNMTMSPVVMVIYPNDTNTLHSADSQIVSHYLDINGTEGIPDYAK